MTSARGQCSIWQVIAAMTMLSYLSGCTGWHQRPESQPAPLIKSGQSLRITLRNGERVELGKTKLIGDSLVGVRAEWRGQPNRYAAAVGDISRIEVRKVSASRTVMFSTAMVGLAGIAAVLIYAAASDEIDSYSFGRMP